MDESFNRIRTSIAMAFNNYMRLGAQEDLFKLRMHIADLLSFDEKIEYCGDLKEEVHLDKVEYDKNIDG